MNSKENSGYFPPTDWRSIEDLPAKDLAQRKQFFSDFLEAYQPALLAFLTKALKLDQNEAEEIAQDFVLEKILSEKVFEYANQQVRFRDLIRIFLKRFYITKLRKLKPISGFEEQLESKGHWCEPDFEFDQPWAVTVFQSALRQFKEHSAKQNEPFWELFEARILSQPPMPYAQIIETFGLASPEHASNRLMTAKRTFNRIIKGELEKQDLTGSPPSTLVRDVGELKKHLASSGSIFRVVHEAIANEQCAVDETRGVSVFENCGSDINLLDERETFSSEIDLAEIADHLLRLNLKQILVEFDASAASRFKEYPQAVETVLDFIDSQEVSFDLIVATKFVFNTKAKDFASCTPSKINVMMTFVCIAKASAGFAERFDEVTGMRRDKAKDGLEYFLTQNWIPKQVSLLFSQAIKSLVNRI